MLHIDIQKQRDAFALEVSIDMPADCRVLGIVGPSGGGKTTLLDCIAGIETPDRGRIRTDKDVWFDSQAGANVALGDRRIGYVFQDGLLFDHLSVRANLEYGARRGGPADATRQMADELGIGHLLDRSPREASGGERRRIAMGRALLSEPGLLLLDEPLTGLDALTAGRVLVYLRRLLSRTRVPAIYVSHAPSDVMQICDRVIGIADGRVVHSGDAASVLSVAACTGSRELAELRSIIDARLVASDTAGRTSTFETADGVRIVSLGTSEDRELDVPCALAIFARDVVLASQRPQGISARNIFAGRVRRIERTQALAVVEVDIGIPIYSEVGYETLREMSLDEGGDIFVFFKASAVQRLL